MNAAASGSPHARPRLAALAGLALALALHAAVAWTLLGVSTREPVHPLRNLIIVSLLEAPPEPALAAERGPEQPAPPRREPPARAARPVQPPPAAAPVRAAAAVPLMPEPAAPAPMPTPAPAATPTARPAEVAPPLAADAPPLPGSDAVLAATAPSAPVPVPAPARAPVSAGVVCANFRTAMGDAAFPREALRRGLDKGEALVEFTLGATGRIRDVRAVHASHPVFARSSMRIVQAFECAGQGHDLVVQVPFSYRLE